MSRKLELEKLLENEFALSQEQLSKLSIYYKKIEEDSKLMNLTTINDLEGVYIKHFYDSIYPFKDLLLDDKVLLDIGSGAGFPGIPLKIVFPNLSVILLEPTLKRCRFLNQVIAELELKQITVVNERAENYIENNRERFDYVTARAVASLAILVELGLPYCRLNGVFMALKGPKNIEEIASATNAISKLGGHITDIFEFILPENVGKRTVITIKKNQKTPKQYPRSFAKIKKEPLK